MINRKPDKPNVEKCPICGTENPNNARFCGSCGKELSPVNKPQPVVTSRTPPQAAATPPVSAFNGNVLSEGEIVVDLEGVDRFVITSASSSASPLRMYKAAALDGQLQVWLYESLSREPIRGLMTLAQSANGRGSLPGIADIHATFSSKPFDEVERYYIAEVIVPAMKDVDLDSANTEQWMQWARQLASGLQILHRQVRCAFNLTSETIRNQITIGPHGAMWIRLGKMVSLGEMPRAEHQDVRALAGILRLRLAGRQAVHDQLKATADAGSSQTVEDLLRVLGGGAAATPTKHVEVPQAREQPAATTRIGNKAPAEHASIVVADRNLRLTIGHATDRGIHREGNEDSYCVLDLIANNDDHGQHMALCAVADGMGGEAAGEVASLLTLQMLIQSAAMLVTDHNLVKPREWIQSTVRTINEQIVTAARKRDNQMGATLVFALISEGVVYLGNVGDSRIYKWNARASAGQMVRLVKDHSLVQRLVDQGEISDDERYTHPERNMLQRSLGDPRAGYSDENEPLTAQAGDCILLCSDGLWEMVRDNQIRDILSRTASPQEACDQLIVEANRNGGEDNITAVIARFG